MDEQQESRGPGSAATFREMGIGQILDSAIKLYIANWKTYLTITALIMIPAAAVQSLITSRLAPDIERDLMSGPLPGQMEPGEVMTPGDLQAMLSLALVGVAFFLLIMPLVTGAVARATSSIYLGERESPRAIMEFALSRFWSLLIVSLLVGIAVTVGFVLLIIPGIIFFLRLVFSAVVVVAEGKKGQGALRRSWSLAKGAMGKIFLTVLLAGILSLIAQSALGFPLTLVGAVLGGGAGAFVNFAAQAITSVLVTPFSTIVLVMLYFDMRIRKEGFDLEVMSNEIGQKQA